MLAVRVGVRRVVKVGVGRGRVGDCDVCELMDDDGEGMGENGDGGCGDGMWDVGDGVCDGGDCGKCDGGVDAVGVRAVRKGGVFD